MLPPQRRRNGVEVGAHVVGRKVSTQCISDMFGEWPIPTAEEEGAEHAASSEPVHGDHDVDVFEKRAEQGRLSGVDERRGQMLAHPDRLHDCVERGTGSLGGPMRDDIGHHFEVSSVVRHEPDPATQLAHFFDAGCIEERGEVVHTDMMHRMMASCRSGDSEPQVSGSTMTRMLVWMDLEMTGLDHTSDVIVEIATLITDDELNIIAEGPDVVVHASDAVLAAMDPFVVAMHTKSGLLDQIKASTVTLEQAGAETMAFIRDHVPEARTVPLCGNSIGTDRRFLATYLPEIEEYLHYRSIDVSSVKELVKRWYPTIDEDRPRSQGTHRALDDIRESVRELVYYRENVFVEPESADALGELSESETTVADDLALGDVADVVLGN
jgi:oligoribonuclease